MSAISDPSLPRNTRRPLRSRVFRGCTIGCAGVVLLLLGAIALLVLILSQAPRSYPVAANPVPPPPSGDRAGGGLDGFDSPYLGHTGSWDGKGGSLGGGTKEADLAVEAAMGLRWTFMPVYWRALEPLGPVDPSRDLPPAWRELDAFVIAAHRRRLNILMQAPVVGGNAGGPPAWAGRRERGKSAPMNLDAAASFAGRLAERYRPGGTLAQREAWGSGFGVRAWELENEPEGYRTSWKGQAGDYAEFVTLSARRIRAADPRSVIVAPGIGAGDHGLVWLAEALAASTNGSPVFRAAGRRFSLGPVVDVISFHNYEGLDSAFGGGHRTIGTVFEGVRGVVEEWEQRVPGFEYRRKQDYWHTEGNYDFVGLLPAERRAAWRFQFFTRAFASGIRKVCVMDASRAEQDAIRAYVKALPRPWPMLVATNQIKVLRGSAMAFRHPEGSTDAMGQVWVLWAVAGAGDAVVEIPATRPKVRVVSVKNEATLATTTSGWARVELAGDSRMAPGVLVIDREDR